VGVEEGEGVGGGVEERGVWGRRMGLEGWWSLAVVGCFLFLKASYLSVQTLLLW